MLNGISAIIQTSKLSGDKRKNNFFDYFNIKIERKS